MQDILLVAAVAIGAALLTNFLEDTGRASWAKLFTWLVTAYLTLKVVVLLIELFAAINTLVP